MSTGAKITYVTLMSDPSIHPAFEEALREVTEKRLGKSYPMYIGGEEVWSEAGEFEDRSPIDVSILIGRFQKAEKRHVVKAIDLANEAFKEWSETSWRESNHYAQGC